MIKNITFPSEGEGYLYKVPEKPNKPNKKDYKYHHTEWGNRKNGYKSTDVFEQDKYDKDMEEYREDMEFYKKNKGKFTNPAARNLVGHTFEFDPKKINILFGPNGSGKTTILRALAGNAFINDGVTTLADCSDVFGFKFGEENKYTKEKVEKYIQKRRQNSCCINWDGQTIYYNNFEYTIQRGGGDIGGMVGTLLESIDEELGFYIGRNQISAGQTTAYLFNKLYRNISNLPTMKELIENDKYTECNDLWKSSYDLQREVQFSWREGYDKKDCPTLLIDEIDKSLDVETIWRLYNTVLPRLQSETGVQIIAISHSPLMLTKQIRENEKFNFISVDPEYTKDMIEMFNGVSF